MSNDPDNIVRLDIDIMASYVRELYDSILSNEPTKHEHSGHKKAATHHRIAEPPAETVPPPTVSAPPVVEAAPPPPPPKQEETPAPGSPPTPVEHKPSPAVVAPHRPSEPVSGGFDVLFEEKQAKELSEKLSELPIPDLKKAIALNDRLLLTSELFAGDGKAFESAINGINSLNSYEEAQSYLIENFVVRYAWTEKKRLEVAKNFIKLVRRRFK